MIGIGCSWEFDFSVESPRRASSGHRFLRLFLVNMLSRYAGPLAQSEAISTTSSSIAYGSLFHLFAFRVAHCKCNVHVQNYRHLPRGLTRKNGPTP